MVIVITKCASPHAYQTNMSLFTFYSSVLLRVSRHSSLTRCRLSRMHNIISSLPSTASSRPPVKISRSSSLRRPMPSVVNRCRRLVSMQAKQRALMSSSLMPALTTRCSIQTSRCCDARLIAFRTRPLPSKIRTCPTVLL